MVVPCLAWVPSPAFLNNGNIKILVPDMQGFDEGYSGHSKPPREPPVSPSQGAPYSEKLPLGEDSRALDRACMSSS